MTFHMAASEPAQPLAFGDAEAARPTRGRSAALVALFAGQAVLLAMAGSRSVASLDSDALSYMRIAFYYAHGMLGYAVSGYWGPLISWIMAPMLWLGAVPEVAFRFACGLSGVVFLAGALRLFEALGLRWVETMVGGVLVALFTVHWSIAAVSPDLLVSGFLLLGFADLIGPGGTGAGVHPLRAGLWFGVAYLAKGVGLPLALGAIVLLQGVRLLSGAASSGAIVRATAMAVAGLALVSLPWICVLSVHYGAPTFSTAGRINFDLVGPHGGHPSMDTFNAPEAGRVMSWEDPSRMPYVHWSPLESAGAMRHFLGNVAGNALYVVQELTVEDMIGLGLVAATLGFLMHAPFGEGFRRDPWRLSLPVLLVCAGVYLPVYGRMTRYYLVCYPFLLAASFGFLRSLASAATGKLPAPAHARRVLGLVGLVLIVALALPGTGRRAARAAVMGRTDLSYALGLDLTAALRSVPPGGIASVPRSPEGGQSMDDLAIAPLRVALYAAFHSGRPFYGAPPGVRSADEALASGAEVFVVRSDTELDRSLSTDPRVRPLPWRDEAPPVRVYYVRKG